MGSDYEWDMTPYNVMVGTQEARVLASLNDSRGNNVCVLCKFHDSDSIWSLRWKIQVIVDLETDDIETAKGAIDAMMQMEESAARGGDVDFA